MKTMKHFFYLALLMFGTFAYAQVGIGTNTPNHALEVDSDDSGIVIPRVQNTGVVDANMSAPPVDGTMVYSIDDTCIRAYEGGSWSACLSAGGGAVIRPARLDSDGGGLTDADLNGNVIFNGAAFGVLFTLDTINNPQNGDTVTISDVGNGTVTISGQHPTARSAPAQNGGAVTYVYVVDSSTPANTGWYHTSSF